jgi:hypothetical protein
VAEHPAQTNLQLYNQLVALSWSDEDLRRTRAAYEFADRALIGMTRRSGKPFIAHLVGTASVVADVDGRPDVVLAALLHAAYTLGGTTLSSKAPSRSTIRSLVGLATEALIFAYATSPWNADAFADANANLAEFDRTRRDVLLMRLANEVDEHADFAIQYSDKGGFLRDSGDRLQPMAALADRLECPKLAATFRLLFDEQRGVSVPSVLRASTHTSPARASASFSARASSSGRAMVTRGRRLLVSVPGARAVVHAVRRLAASPRSVAGGR